ncbi:phytanoyl-CoA dioxygenase family protein [Microbulbifer variabilis]|uniref:phytanoyl-CoA dioxygenase family protein n=1 Tax=Microbulbifer variabilis TaxID=266805 RepID=UPI001CFC6B52|nr:phytanoyl-CoA dioxygenase family protein [Microbulbifer variabilis]
MAKKSTLKEMLKGFGSLKEVADGFQITGSQYLRVWVMMGLVVLYKVFILPWQKDKKKQLFDDLGSLKNMTLTVPRDMQEKSKRDGCFLNNKELDFFEKNGYLPPFRVLSESEAKQLKNELQEEFSCDFHGEIYLSEKIKNIAKRHGQWVIEGAGLYQALRIKSLRELFRRPQISERLASILGDEVMCWRSQMFHKSPGSEGTIWHQNATFRESGKYAKLQPTQKMDPAVIQLNAWVALTDCTEENGCLRLLPGSMADARMDYLYSYSQDNKIFYLSLQPFSFTYLFTLLKIALYGTIFVKSVLLFRTAVELLGEDYFDKFDVVDIHMKAGECLIFSSLNMHASYPNTSKEDSRFSVVARCTPNHVKVAPSGVDVYSTAEGLVEYKLPDVPNFQVFGEDAYGYNKIIED